MILQQTRHTRDSRLFGFNYSKLPGSRRDEVQGEARVIHLLIAKTASNIVQIGLRLIAVRRIIGREHFSEWLDQEFQWSQPSASRYMQAARYFGDIECTVLERFQPGALYVLAREKLPAFARREAIDNARSGL